MIDRELPRNAMHQRHM